ncbi:MAG: hypothetical protein ACLTBV_26920 [Enterocloster bolteae]
MLDLEDLKSRLGPGYRQLSTFENQQPFWDITSKPRVRKIGKLAKAAGAEFIVYTDPISLGVLEAPANYGATICVERPSRTGPSSELRRRPGRLYCQP